MMRVQPAMIALNLIFAVFFGVWSIRRFLEDDMALGVFLILISAVNGFIAMRRYKIAKLHEDTK
ncbi:hypothetical protein [Jeotgalibacillus haloalkalitolerans]|uniref:DUF4305 domain-containing protein n=1 Tax=Jeotgalibacillus haloalkalitolerans TaxID=3104292 RepID=A0ABU5KLP7_9BACL|nr:hypothetical protein [Jeotgalibacillus sp. HH7-29]MDZ5711881.1 hypothetical protein [Jeotgalibacillus sp. HH7-29]